MSKKTQQILVAWDTHILAWCVRRADAPAPSDDESQRAGWLLEELKDVNAQILIPTVVLAEYLVPVKSKDHAGIIAAINKEFIVAPFDMRCASLAAELFSKGKTQRPNNVPYGREILRADAMIIATAKVHSAKLFYTNDANCLKLAKTVLDARSLPNNSPHLFAAPRKPSRKRHPQ